MVNEPNESNDLLSEIKRPKALYYYTFYNYLALTIVIEPRTFAKMYVCLNGMKRLSRHGDVTVKEARDS